MSHHEKWVGDPELVVNEISQGQLSSIQVLEELCFKDPYPPSFLAHLAQSNPKTFLVASVRHEIVGYTVARKETNYSHLISIAVHPDEQRKGIGKLLLDLLEARLDRASPVRLEVRASNAPAISFYQKNGFRTLGTERDYYSDGETAIVMIKEMDLSSQF